MSVMSPSASISERRRDQIVEGAATVFLQYGYRQSTLDEIARQAEVSRPALYQYFTDKADIFREVVRRLNAEALDKARSQLASNEPLADRIAGALREKYAPVIEQVGRSPHSTELFDRNARIAGDLAQDAHAQLEKAIQSELRKAQDLGLIDLKNRSLSALAAARLFDTATQGLVQHALVNPGSWPTQLFQLVELMVNGLSPEQ
jgi:AcrR family transcriptional regulator